MVGQPPQEMSKFGSGGGQCRALNAAVKRASSRAEIGVAVHEQTAHGSGSTRRQSLTTLQRVS